ncbi:MAG: hypothetical protein V5A62_00080 [Haloarculaceae archaeon]
MVLVPRGGKEGANAEVTELRAQLEAKDERAAPLNGDPAWEAGALVAYLVGSA